MVTVIRPHNSDEIAAGSPRSFDAYSDIGARLNGRTMKAEHFIAYERLMIGAIASFLSAAQDHLRIGQFETSRTSVGESRRLERDYEFDRVMIKKLPTPHSEVSLLDALDLARMTLRTCLWVQLFCGGRSVHFGYDLYVFFAGGRLSAQWKEAFLLTNMQVEARSQIPLGWREPKIATQ